MADELDPVTRALTRTMADYASAHAGVLTAILSVLVQRKILTESDVREDILNSLEKVAQEHPEEGEAKAVGAIVARIRGQLFGERFKFATWGWGSPLPNPSQGR